MWHFPFIFWFASRVGAYALANLPGSRKGMRPLRQRNGSCENVSPPRIKPAEGFLFGAAHHTRSGDLVPDCQPVQVAELAKTEFAMTVDIVRLLPADEHDLLEYYVEGTCPPDDIDAFYDALEVPNNATPPRLAIAVAQILLHHVQGALPQWASVRGDKVFLNRKEHRRHKDARLAFNPLLVCTINWADSGPGL